MCEDTRFCEDCQNIVLNDGSRCNWFQNKGCSTSKWDWEGDVIDNTCYQKVIGIDNCFADCHDIRYFDGVDQCICESYECPYNYD
jgi:hypothetical protein